MNKQKRAVRVVWRVFAVLFVLVVASSTLYPFLWMLSGSFKPAADLFGSPAELVPNHPTLANYGVVAEDGGVLGRMFLNSLFIATSITVLQSLFCAMAAFAFAKLRFRGSSALFVLFMTALMVPVQLTIIPNFFTLGKAGLIDTPWALIVLDVFSAFGVFLLRQFFMTVPKELHEAALIDGGGPWRSFWSIHLPLARPILAVNAILTFNAAWGDFFKPLVFLKSLDHMTLPLGISLIQGLYSQQGPTVMLATLVVAVVPVVIVFLVARKQLIHGLAYTGVKG